MDENLNNIATKTKANPNNKYGILMLSILTFFASLLTPPKMAKPNKTGPIVVPKLLIPPARLNRCDPFAGSPKLIANGLAAVCCKENPIPTINNPVIIV